MFLPDLMNGTPNRLWEDASTRKTEILMIADKRERSATFAAAYADIYMRCPTLHWAGMAAFVAKDIGNEFTHIRSTPIHYALANMTRAIFDSTYAYLDYYAGLKAQFPQSAPGQLAELLPADMPYGLKAAFQCIDKGECRQGALDMLRYEQTHVLQDAHYNRPFMRLLLRLNEACNQVFERIDVALAATSPEETPDERGVEVRFPLAGASITHLADRMGFSEAIADCFFRLCDKPGGNDYLAEELATIMQRNRYPALLLRRNHGVPSVSVGQAPVLPS